MRTHVGRPFAFAVALALAVALTGSFAPGKDNRIKLRANLDSILWVQTSVEFKMSVTQAYRTAEVMAERALTVPDWTAIPEQKNARDLRKTAVILDLDETLLDNSRFEGQLILDNTPFSYSRLKQWWRTGKPRLFPGAEHFLRRMQELKVDIFYITNRENKFANETIKVLQDLNVPVNADGSNLLSKDKPPTTGADKKSRREIVAQTHRVLLLLGDDLNDFISGVQGTNATLQGREKIADAHQDWWGRRWIIIPNPVYGSWERALYGFDNRLTDQQKLEAKYRHLQGR